MKDFCGDASNESKPRVMCQDVATSLAPRNSASLQVHPSWPEVLGAGRGLSHGGVRWYPQSVEARARLPAVTVGTATARALHSLMFTALRQ